MLIVLLASFVLIILINILFILGIVFMMLNRLGILYLTPSQRKHTETVVALLITMFCIVVIARGFLLYEVIING